MFDSCENWKQGGKNDETLFHASVSRSVALCGRMLVGEKGRNIFGKEGEKSDGDRHRGTVYSIRVTHVTHVTRVVRFARFVRFFDEIR